MAAGKSADSESCGGGSCTTEEEEDDRKQGSNQRANRNSYNQNLIVAHANEKPKELKAYWSGGTIGLGQGPPVPPAGNPRTSNAKDAELKQTFFADNSNNNKTVQQTFVDKRDNGINVLASLGAKPELAKQMFMKHKLWLCSVEETVKPNGQVTHALKCKPANCKGNEAEAGENCNPKPKKKKLKKKKTKKNGSCSADAANGNCANCCCCCQSCVPVPQPPPRPYICVCCPPPCCEIKQKGGARKNVCCCCKQNQNACAAPAAAPKYQAQPPPNPPQPQPILEPCACGNPNCSCLPEPIGPRTNCCTLTPEEANLQNPSPPAPFN